MKPRWCGVPSDEYHQINGCLNWLCICGHTLRKHFTPIYILPQFHLKCIDCKDCQDFKFRNNSRCSIECLFEYKLLEVNK